MRFFRLGWAFLFILWTGFAAAQTWKSNLENIPPVPAFDRALFVSGAGAQGNRLNLGHVDGGRYFSEFEPVFRKYKIKYRYHSVSDSGGESVMERVENLIADIKRMKPGEKIFLICHSMGGLVCRLALRDPSIWEQVSGALLLSGANWGTDGVDAVSKYMTLLRPFSKVAGFDIGKKEYIKELSYEYVSKNFVSELDFQKGMPPIYSVVVADTPYEIAKKMLPLGASAQVITHRLENLPSKQKYKLRKWGTLTDGMVPAYSQEWGYHLGTLTGNHATVIGKTIRSSDRAVFDAFKLEMVNAMRPDTVSAAEIAAANCTCLLNAK